MPEPKDRAALNTAYADSMRAIWKGHPDNATAGVLFADALIDCHPWDQWTLDGHPKEGTLELMDTLAQVLKLDRRNPHALHLYIHAYEASPFPEKACFAADELENLAPGLPHLQHMPCHIYAHTGDWEKGIQANLNCLKASEAYAKARKTVNKGLYLTHYEMALTFAACMSGHKAIAETAINGIFRNLTPAKAIEDDPDVDGGAAMPLEVMKRFGDWDGILSAPDYGPKAPISNTMRLADRTIAFAAKGQMTEAVAEQKALEAAFNAIPDTLKVDDDTTARQLLSIWRHLVSGEILVHRDETTAQGLHEMRQAVTEQDALMYSEPPDWLIPARHSLGAALFRAGQYAEAESVYKEDLRLNPKNVWGLVGLMKTYRSEGKTAEARKSEKDLNLALKNADIKINTSCLCLPEG